MARPFLADPEFVKKAAQGRSDEINICIGCNQACLDHTFSMKTSSCLVNPRACNETELNYLPTTQKKKVAVVGAGAAGMQASIVLDERGRDRERMTRALKCVGLLMQKGADPFAASCLGASARDVLEEARGDVPDAIIDTIRKELWPVTSLPKHRAGRVCVRRRARHVEASGPAQLHRHHPSASTCVRRLPLGKIVR